MLKMRWTVPVLLGMVGLMSGCTNTPVQAWEKGYLAKPEMTFNANALESRYGEHIYTSKEGASGGSSVGGGGCGCN